MRNLLIPLATGIALTLTGCSPESSAADHEEVNLKVLAAASLQESFTEISEEFTAEHPKVTVDFHFAGSSTLAHNLEAGAPADVFATADETHMDRVQDAKLIHSETREIFATNTLVGIVPADNPKDISRLEEANADDVNLVICAPQVPCGALSQALAETNGMTLNAVSEEQQVSDVLGKVRSGQADAGLVYATDVALAPGEVDTFDIEGAADQPNYYPIARTTNSENHRAADAFLEFVHSNTGQSILEAHGFKAP